jgi:hypothetical protein
MASIAVRSYMESLLLKKTADITSDSIFIVGKGKGSKNKGKPVLLPTVLELLQSDFNVDPTIDEQNYGRIRVSQDSIKKFIECKRWKD